MNHPNTIQMPPMTEHRYKQELSTSSNELAANISAATAALMGMEVVYFKDLPLAAEVGIVAFGVGFVVSGIAASIDCVRRVRILEAQHHRDQFRSR